MGKFLYLLTNSEFETFQKPLMTGDRIFFFFLECSKNGLSPKNIGDIGDKTFLHKHIWLSF